MLMQDFVRILKTFSDNPTDVDASKGILVLQVRDELIEIRVHQRAGSLHVTEDGLERAAVDWLINRVARVNLLADRILSYVRDPEYFVTPSGELLDQLDYQNSLNEVSVSNAARAALDVLDRRPAGTTSVMYLISDAGEGKTTLINYLSREQARAYKEKTTDWLLVPIPLGGRGFLRFDDVVIAALVNKLRVQWLYYDAFIELVRLGVIIPAFDGFEEMFVEGSSGDAVSALGSLMRNLSSAGTTLIAARKAYFEYQSLRTQAKLFDAIGSDSVSFSRLALNRWNKDNFLEYAKQREVANAEFIYQAIRDRLNEDHPLLTRAVLVRRLFDVIGSNPDVDAILELIGKTPRDYFFQFVNAIIEREAKEKWLSKSGEAQHPLLTVAEHHEILCAVAQEMWLSSTDALRPEVLDVIADIFCEQNKKDPVVSRQVKERLKQHSLLSTAETLRGAFSFDHEDFRKFFLGEALGRLLSRQARNDVHAVLAIATLPKETCDHAVHYLRRSKDPLGPALTLVGQLSAAELPTSFVRENAGAIAVWILDDNTVSNRSIEQMNFPPDALRAKSLSGITFENCYFQPTSLDHSNLAGCAFSRCRFERLEIDRRKVNCRDTFLEASELNSLVRVDEDDQLFDPAAITSALRSYGIDTRDGIQSATVSASRSDEESKLLEKVLRIYLRSTHVNEHVMRLRLGAKANIFFGNVLPRLIRAGILEEVPYLGSGSQRRFKLAVPMRQLQDALIESKGDFRVFITLFPAK